MNCPNCNSTTSVEVNTHSRGYATDVMECGICETVWLCKNGEVTILKTRSAA